MVNAKLAVAGTSLAPDGCTETIGAQELESKLNKKRILLAWGAG